MGQGHGTGTAERAAALVWPGHNPDSSESTAVQTDRGEPKRNCAFLLSSPKYEVSLYL